MSAPEACCRSATTPRSTADRPELLSTCGRINSPADHKRQIPSPFRGRAGRGWMELELSLREASVPRHRSKPLSARLWMAREGLPVDTHQAELRRVAERPLEVVEPRPVQVAAHVDALGQARLNLPDREIDVSDALR